MPPPLRRPSSHRVERPKHGRRRLRGALLAATFCTLSLLPSSCSTAPTSAERPRPGRSSGDPDAATGAGSDVDGGQAGVVDPETGIPYAPDGTESILYELPGPNVLLAYSRVIRLAHGSSKGTLLGTFEHSRTDGAPSQYIVRKSVDDGLTWSTLAMVGDGEAGAGHPASTMYQPFLFELPAQMGTYPPGTLLLTGNVLPRIGDRHRPGFELWRSLDAGATWSFVSTYQEGETGERRGIWEAFLDVDGEGRLVCYFADERRSATQSQLLAHIVSTDGGDTWSANRDGSTRVSPGLVVDVASSVKTDRPGMPTVATLPDESRVLAYELCEGGLQTCEIRVKTSNDGGATWGAGPTDMGTLVRTGDGRYASNSPYITYSSRGQLLLGSMRARKVSDNSFALEDYQVVFVNTEGGKGLWSWTPAPRPVPREDVPAPCYMNYSPHLLVSQTGSSLRYTAPAQDPSHPCAERTYTANAGTLPFASSFGGGLAGGWRSYGGCWKVVGGVYSDTCGGPALGHKALAGSTGWKDYRLEGDVRIDTPGSNAGFLVRLSNPGVGVDAHQGYYVGIGDSLFLGRQNYDYVGLASVPIPGGTAAGVFFHVTVEVVGCDFALSARRVGSMDTPTTLTFSDPGCTASTGAIGVRDFEGNASFKEITVIAR